MLSRYFFSTQLQMRGYERGRGESGDGSGGGVSNYKKNASLN